MLDYFRNRTNNASLATLSDLHQYPQLNMDVEVTRLKMLAMEQNVSVKRSFGLGFSEMFLECRFGLINCTADKSLWQYSFQFGNCYTLNSGFVHANNTPDGRMYSPDNSNVFKATQTTAVNSFKAVLFTGNFRELFANRVDDSESVPGVVLRIFNQSRVTVDMPIMLQNSMCTYIALRKTIAVSLPQPYSTCVANADSPLFEELRKDSPFVYTRKGCLGKCFDFE